LARIVVKAERGRLGNQLFQYGALRAMRPDLLLLAGFDELFATFEDVPAWRLPTCVSPSALAAFFGDDSTSERLRFRRVERIVAQRGPQQTPEQRRRLIGYCVRDAFFQTDDPARTAHVLGLNFARTIKIEASALLQRFGLDGRPYAFVHVRGDDYRRWPSKERPAVLPARWYRACISEVRRAHPDAALVIFTDDVPLAQSLEQPDALVFPSSSAGVDLLLMQGAIAGVISASTFSWWGSRFAAAQGAPGPFFAPEFWTGHPIGRWRAPGLRSSRHLSFTAVS
jgi:hypothetical protein